MEKLNCVLLVDDNQTTCFIQQRLILNLDIANQIVVAPNGKDALAFMEQHYLESAGYPELVLLDLKMPVMDGFGFLAAFQQLGLDKQPATQVVVLTTSLSASDIERAKKAGFQHFVNKPLTAQKLKAIWPKQKRSLVFE